MVEGVLGNHNTAQHRQYSTDSTAQTVQYSIGKRRSKKKKKRSLPERSSPRCGVDDTTTVLLLLLLLQWQELSWQWGASTVGCRCCYY